MSSFKWNVSEPADDAASGLQSGTIDLEKIVVLTRTPSWHIETADGSVLHLSQPGGEVKLQKPAAAAANNSESGIISRGVINFGLVVFIALAAALVIYGMFAGTLALFKEFIAVIAGFLAGLGVGKVARKSKAPAR